MVEVFMRRKHQSTGSTDPGSSSVRVQVKHELLYGDGQPLTSEEVASLLHLTRQAVDKRRSKANC